ncbi:MAG: Fis family transcriptional regulator [Pseudonocardiales bacterium]|nr:Fis family transcriptional regulator [Pseudonocardiales bacterium]
MTHVLIVEDEPPILRALVMNLTHRGYEVSQSETGRNALEQIRLHTPDVLILDLGLPDMDGMDVIRRTRTTYPTLPIIVLSARTTSHDKVTALDLGAVDYVTKPFDMNELVARLRAAARRFEAVISSDHVQMGSIDVDLAARSIIRANATDEDHVHLTPTEWHMLEILLRRPGTLVTSDELLTALRGDPENTESSYLRIYMAQLRRKLEAVPSRPRYLITEPGVGYRFRP